MHAGSLHVLNCFPFSSKCIFTSFLFQFLFIFFCCCVVFTSLFISNKLLFFPLWSMYRMERIAEKQIYYIRYQWFRFFWLFLFSHFFGSHSLNCGCVSVSNAFKSGFDHFLAEMINNVFSKEKFIFWIWVDWKLSHYRDDTIFIEFVDFFFSRWWGLNILSSLFHVTLAKIGFIGGIFQLCGSNTFWILFEFRKIIQFDVWICVHESVCDHNPCTMHH